ncbi:hypothetical protein I3843_13G058400 [Carya illinoinensis]|uniref:Wound-induced protein 1 n=1 Tax=Carya illinoinensis TaxID=32201 RepID=A0A8T1NQG0_CARIL|nr:wound-induced protein 1-like [Carya illinoinensis]KAG2672957.1 hypothetical protein I3760_13G066400 [Carya illinoinensis]KAG6631117.1 hypothetical protein CIPAW_13G067800 [Carya illinoinensis]KAG6680927.1 hypothetical protein I3842_13G066700 [Carya illinoinensis]KAG7949363.1 hypothetical protein I3843_13G058400 [Carya illinoinensis]
MEDKEEENGKKVVTALYSALISKDFDEVQRLLAPNVEWWFHGPPNHQHLMLLLTGSSPPNNTSFVFVPQPNIVAFGPIVLVEGYNKEHSISWVHIWTVTEGILTQVREYSNTSVTVARFESQPLSSPAVDTSGSANHRCQNVWKSQLSRHSAPGLVLAL